MSEGEIVNPPKDNRIPIENLFRGFSRIETAASTVAKFATVAHQRALSSMTNATEEQQREREQADNSDAPRFTQAVKLVGRDLFETVYTAALKGKRQRRRMVRKGVRHVLGKGRKVLGADAPNSEQFGSQETQSSVAHTLPTMLQMSNNSADESCTPESITRAQNIGGQPKLMPVMVKVGEPNNVPGIARSTATTRIPNVLDASDDQSQKHQNNNIDAQLEEQTDVGIDEEANNSDDGSDYEWVSNENLYECPYEGDPVQAEINKLNRHVETLEPHGRHWAAILQVESHPSADPDWMSVSAMAADGDTPRVKAAGNTTGTSVEALLESFQRVTSKKEELSHIETVEQIDRDIPRTYPNISYFRDSSVSLSLRRVLLALAALHPEVNYVQGLNFVAAFALLHTGSEDDCLWLLDRLMVHKRFQLENVYRKGLPNLIKFNLLMVRIVKEADAELYGHLEQIGMGMLYCFHNWLLTLFAYTMPFDRLVLVWDYFLENGWGAFFRICTILVLDKKDELMQSDMEQASKILKEVSAKPPVELISRARELHLSDDIKVSISDAASHSELMIEQNATQLYGMGG